MWYESRLESDFTALGKIGNVPQFSFWQLGTPTVTCSVLLNAPAPEVELKGHPFAQKGICYKNSFYRIARAYTLYTWRGLGTTLIWI